MSFIDKVRAATEQAAARAKEEMQIIQARRELNVAYSELGRTAFELADKGGLANAGLDEGVERVRTLKTKLAALESSEPAASGGEPQPATPADTPSEPE